MLKIVKLLCLVYLGLGIVFHISAYLNFANHLQSGIPFEIMTLFKAHPTEAMHLLWGGEWQPYYPPGTSWAYSLSGVYTLEVNDSYSYTSRGIALDVIWGNTTEGKIRKIERDWIPSFLLYVNWLEGKPVSGKDELTLIGQGEYEGVEPVTGGGRWCDKKKKYVHDKASVIRTSSDIYNLKNIWFILSAITSTEVLLEKSPKVATTLEEMMTVPDKRYQVFAVGTFAETFSPKDDPKVVSALTDVVERIKLYQPGKVSKLLLFGVIRKGIYFRDAGIFKLHDTLAPFWTYLLEYPTLPVRYLMFTPLIFIPHQLVFPFALIYAAFLFGFFAFGVYQWFKKILRP